MTALLENMCRTKLLAEGKVRDLQARVAVAEEKAQAGAAEVARREAMISQKDLLVAQLRSFQKESEADNARLRSQVEEAREEARQAESRIAEANVRAAKLADEAEEAKKAATDAVEEFKESLEFREVVAESCLDTYNQGFDAAKAKAAERFPDLDFSFLKNLMEEGEEGVTVVVATPGPEAGVDVIEVDSSEGHTASAQPPAAEEPVAEVLGATPSEAAKASRPRRAIRKVSSSRTKNGTDQVRQELEAANKRAADDAIYIAALEKAQDENSQKLEQAGKQVRLYRERSKMKHQISVGLADDLKKQEEKYKALSKDFADRTATLQEAVSEVNRYRGLWKGAETAFANMQVAHKRIMEEAKSELAELRKAVQDQDSRARSREARDQEGMQSLQDQVTSTTEALEAERANHRRTIGMYQELNDRSGNILSSLLDQGILRGEHFPPP